MLVGSMVYLFEIMISCRNTRLSVYVELMVMSIAQLTSAWNSFLSEPSDVAVRSSSEKPSINLSSAASSAVVQEQR